jgi:predicted secreted protein
MRNFYLKICILLIMFWAKLSFAQAFTENFDNVATLTASGWYQQNNSSTIGTNPNWIQGVPTPTGPFDSYNGAANSYICANYNSTTGNNTISNWLVAPNRTLRNGDVFTFYTRIPTPAPTEYPDRLEVRMSTNGASVNVGTGPTGLGDFTTLLLSVNPNLTTGVYPKVWTQFTITISGLPAPTSGRIAFRYFVTSGGPTGTNSDYIGIDNVVYTPYVCPAFTMTPGGALTAGAAGSPYSKTLTQTGALGTPSFAITAGALPPGLTLSSSGTISGTPTATGTFNFTATVSDASGCSGSQNYSITVLCPSNPITIANFPTLCSNSGLYTLTEASPAGGTYSGTGVSGGKFDPAAGTQTITYDYTDAYGCAHSMSKTITVNPEQNITTQPSASTICAGANTTFSATANNATGYQWQVNTGSGFTNVSNTAPYSGATTATLTITGATAAMNGYVYRVVISGSTGCDPKNSNSAALTVNSAPSITTQPIASTICAGSNTTFTAAASNATGYQWQVDSGSGFTNISNTAPYSGATTATLTITGATAGLNGYVYRVVVTGLCTPVVTSNSAALTVNSAPSITTQPIASTICSGSNATFTAAASNATGYQWQVDSGSGFTNISNTAPYSGATTATLTITGATAGLNGYVYRVVVTGLCTPVVTSNSAALTVNSAPSITTQPIASTICAGSNTTFTAAASNATGYQWQVDSGSGFTNISNTAPYSGATTATLTITGATAGLNGNVYRVLVTGLCTPTATSNSAALTVNSAPVITTQPIASTICAGSNTTFTAAASNATGYQWQVDSGSGFTNISNTAPYSGATTATLTITGATAGLNGYVYRVVVTGLCTPVVTSNSAALTVNSAPSITTQPIASTICSGSNATFTAAASNATGYQWQVDSGSGFTNISNTAPYSGATTATLTITGATAGLNGYVYRVVVTGLCTPVVTSNSAALTVNSAPSITTQPIASTICAGSNTTFTAAASNATGYQWQVDSGSGFTNISNTAPYSGATTATLTITGATAGLNGNVYRVLVTGLCTPTATSNSAALTVNSAPVITTQPIASTICAGSNTTFTAAASNATGYQWQVDSGSGFTNISNTAPYSGATTATLTITGATADLNGYLYRVVVTGLCTPTATSNNVALTVLSVSGSTTKTDVTCNGSSNGTITLTPSGGVSPYTFVWNDGADTQNRTGLAAGTYTVLSKMLMVVQDLFL